MIRVLILEDQYETRKDLLTKGWPKDTFIAHYASAQQIFDDITLRSEPNFFNYFLLDHDLAFDISIPDGSRVAKFIHLHKIGLNARYVIHSTNQMGSRSMAFNLTDKYEDGTPNNRQVVLAPFYILRRGNQSIPEILGIS